MLIIIKEQKKRQNNKVHKKVKHTKDQKYIPLLLKEKWKTTDRVPIN